MRIAMILAGGTGTRVGAKIPKQFVEVLGKPIIAYTIEIFQNHPQIEAIELVCQKEWRGFCEKLVVDYEYSKVRWYADGGDTFQKSVINGLEKLKGSIDDTDYVFIQYAASPFTSEKIVTSVIEMTEERGSAVTGTPCFQLLSTKDTKTTSLHWCDRDRYIQIACPYGFRFDYIKGVYGRAEAKELLDKTEPHTTSLIYALGDTVNYTYGDQTNIKITTPEDIALFEGYLLMKKRNR